MVSGVTVSGHQHKERIVNDIGICDCGRVLLYNSYDKDPNIKPVVLKEGHVPGLEYINHGDKIEVWYEGRLWATMSMSDEELQYVTNRMIQSMAKCYLKEGSLTTSRSVHDQVKLYIDKGLTDDQIIADFSKDKRDTVRRYVRDLRKIETRKEERKNGRHTSARSKRRW